MKRVNRSFKGSPPLLVVRAGVRGKTGKKNRMQKKGRKHDTACGRITVLRKVLNDCQEGQPDLISDKGCFGSQRPCPKRSR